MRTKRIGFISRLQSPYAVWSVIMVLIFRICG